jgi:hypothetical protein
MRRSMTRPDGPPGRGRSVPVRATALRAPCGAAPCPVRGCFARGRAPQLPAARKCPTQASMSQRSASGSVPQCEARTSAARAVCQFCCCSAIHMVVPRGPHRCRVPVRGENNSRCPSGWTLAISSRSAGMRSDSSTTASGVAHCLFNTSSPAPRITHHLGNPSIPVRSGSTLPDSTVRTTFLAVLCPVVIPTPWRKGSAPLTPRRDPAEGPRGLRSAGASGAELTRKVEKVLPPVRQPGPVRRRTAASNVDPNIA